MQSLWIKTQSGPFEAPYFSCVPYSSGRRAGDAIFGVAENERRTPIPRLPLRPPDDYLRESMVATLAREDVELDIRLQLQTDPHLMPIENNAVLWPERLSPRISVATSAHSTTESSILRRSWILLSGFPTTRGTVSPEHRPLGNQNRARRRMYQTLATLRQTMNATPHYEPTGDEVFE